MQLATILIYFFIYAFLGWIVETLYCTILQKRLVIRGFLVGPYCPIYGFGALFVLAFLSPFKSFPLLIFLLAIVITSSLEYFVSFLLEKLFKKSWWDYSDKFFNINGRISLFYSLAWGALCILLLYFLHPILSEHIDTIPAQPLFISGIVIACVFVADSIYSVRDTLRFNKEIVKLTILTEKIDQLHAHIRDTAGETRAKAEKELTQLLSQYEANARYAFKKIRRILNAFPTIRFKRKDRLSIRERLNGYFNRK